MTPKYRQDAPATVILRLVARHQQRIRYTRQTLPSMPTQQQVRAPCDNTSAFDPVYTKVVAQHGFRHQNKATWRRITLALPHRLERPSFQVARMHAVNSHFKRRDQLLEKLFSK